MTKEDSREKTERELKQFFDNSTDLSEYNKTTICQQQLDEYKFLIANLNNIEDYANYLIANGFNLRNNTFIISIKDIEGYLSKEQCYQLFKTRELLRNHGCSLQIFDGLAFELDDVLNANEQMDNVINQIKNARISDQNNRELTELEKFMWVYSFVSNRKYKETDENLNLSRCITSIFKNQNIVCVGFATLLKEMCSRLNIECYINHCDVFIKGTEKKEEHANNIVVLDGKPYYCDACFDCVTAINKKQTYNYCLIPPKDLESLTKYDIINHTAPFFDVEQHKRIAKSRLIKIQNLETLSKSEYDKILVENVIYSTYKDLVKTETKQTKSDSIKENLANAFNFFSLPNYKEKAEKFITDVIDLLGTKKELEPLSFNDYADAIENIMVARGLSREKAKVKAEDVLNETLAQSARRFNSEAKNGFVTECYAKLEV